MTILAKQKSLLESLGLPDDQQTIRRVRAFLMRAGLTQLEFADLCNMNFSSLRVYLCGQYSGRYEASSTTLAVRALLKETMDRYEVEHPAPEAMAHYETSEYAAVRRSMYTALRNGTSYLVDGPPGTQKTYTFRNVAKEMTEKKLGRAVYVYARVEHSPQSFLIEACNEAGIPSRGSIDQLLRKLRYFLGAGRTLLIVDEAQHLNMKGLEVLRQLLDLPPYFGVILGGSHDLAQRLTRNFEMEQWRSRLRRTHTLNGLSDAEAAHIITAELGRMSKADIKDTIKDATVAGVREGKRFEYVSARNLFFAIQDAQAALKENKEEGAA